MKHIIRNVSSAAFLGLVLITTQATLRAQSIAESTTTTKTVTSAGTVSEFSPDTIVVRSETSSEPIRYSYSKTTTYVDETGAPVSMSVVRSGLPVTVYYTQDGEKMVASKVIVHKTTTTTEPALPVTKSQTTTTTVEKKK